MKYARRPPLGVAADSYSHQGEIPSERLQREGRAWRGFLSLSRPGRPYETAGPPDLR